MENFQKVSVKLLNGAMADLDQMNERPNKPFELAPSRYALWRSSRAC